MHCTLCMQVEESHSYAADGDGDADEGHDSSADPAHETPADAAPLQKEPKLAITADQQHLSEGFDGWDSDQWGAE